MADDLPDIYADQFNISLTAYGVSLTFSLTPHVLGLAPSGGAPTVTPKAVIRMSLEHAKIMTMILRRQLKRFELEALGDPIRVPARVLKELELSEGEW